MIIEVFFPVVHAEAVVDPPPDREVTPAIPLGHAGHLQDPDLIPGLDHIQDQPAVPVQDPDLLQNEMPLLHLWSGGGSPGF